MAKRGPKPGKPQKKKLAWSFVLNQQMPDAELAQLIASVARGVWVEKEMPDGSKVCYKTPPNMDALKTIAEHKHGKARQNVDLTSGGEQIFLRVDA